MPQPEVVAVMLTRNRPQMAARAIKSFLSQTYQNKKLLIWNTGQPLGMPSFELRGRGLPITEVMSDRADITIGALRNAANRQAEGDIICHWDDDDWSAPARMQEQVKLLYSGSAFDAVGLRSMLFWKTHPDNLCEASWRYHNNDHRYALGTSLCYRRSAWVQVPFEENIRDKSHEPRGKGEDRLWIRKVNVFGDIDLPLIVASIHGGNISSSIDERSESWERSPGHDAYCRRVMAL